jgi:hypothetical protein
MRKIITQMMALLAALVWALPPINAQNYEWIMGNDPANFPLTSGYAEVITINGLTIVPKNPMEGTIPTNMGATNASAKTFDGISYINRFQFNGAGYSSAKAGDTEPLVNMPTQRYLQFDVTGPVKVSIVGTSGSSSEARKIFLTDGTDLIGSFDYPDANLYKPSVTYTGDAATLYLFCNAACNIYHIIVESNNVNIKEVNAEKEIKTIGYYDLTGRPVPASTQGVVLVKTVYTDGTSTTSKMYRLNK